MKACLVFGGEQLCWMRSLIADQPTACVCRVSNLTVILVTPVRFCSVGAAVGIWKGKIRRAGD